MRQLLEGTWGGEGWGGARTNAVFSETDLKTVTVYGSQSGHAPAACYTALKKKCGSMRPHFFLSARARAVCWGWAAERWQVALGGLQFVAYGLRFRVKA